MKYCNKCGNSVEDQIKFCPKCGNSMTDVSSTDTSIEETPIAEPKPKTPKKNRKTIYIALGVILLVVAIGGGYFGFTKYQEYQDEQKRIAIEEALAEKEEQAEKERLEKEKQEQIEREKQEQAEKERNAANSNIDQTAIYSLYNGKYRRFLDIIGTPEAIATIDFDEEITNGELIIEYQPTKYEIDDKTRNINRMTIIMTEPFSSEVMLEHISDFPHMTFDQAGGRFLENSIIMENGKKVNIFYFIDEYSLTISHIVISKL